MVRMDIMVHCLECGATQINRFNMKPKPGLQNKRTKCKACGAKFYVQLQGVLTVVPLKYDLEPIGDRRGQPVEAFIRGDGKFSLTPDDDDGKDADEIPVPSG